MTQTASSLPSGAPLSRRTLRTCFLRSYFLLAGMNTKGLQHIGFSSAIDPALCELYTSPEQLREARLRYASHFNCHPFLTPYILGVFIHCEQTIIAGRLPPATFNGIRDTYTYTLSVIGDNLLSGGIYISCALLLCSLLLLGNIPLALSFFALCLLLFHSFRLAFFVVGLRYGLNSMQWLERLRPITLAEHCKYVNALLLSLLFCQSLLYVNATTSYFAFPVLAILSICLVAQRKIGSSRVVSGLAFFLLMGIFTYLFFAI